MSPSGESECTRRPQAGLCSLTATEVASGWPFGSYAKRNPFAMIRERGLARLCPTTARGLGEWAACFNRPSGALVSDWDAGPALRCASCRANYHCASGVWVGWTGRIMPRNCAGHLPWRRGLAD